MRKTISLDQLPRQIENLLHEGENAFDLVTNFLRIHLRLIINY